MNMLLRCAIIGVLASTPALAADHTAEVDAWHARRIESLQKPDGWLSLVGLHWVTPGAHRLGSAADSGIVLNTGPAVLGQLEREGEAVYFTPDPAAGVVIEPAAEGRVRLVADGQPGASVVRFNAGKASFILLQRGDAFALRVRDAEAPTRTGFAGIERYPVDAGWRFSARFEPHPPGKTIDIATVLGTLEPNPNPGVLVFERDGHTHRLEAIASGEQFFIIFADRTNKEETYGAGRFVYTGLPDAEGRVELDFNRAYNPPCAFTAYSTCPLPPPENRLDLFVRAGEKRYRGQH